MGYQPAITAFNSISSPTAAGDGVTQLAPLGRDEFIHFLVMIAQSWFLPPLWRSAGENVCFFSLYSVRVDGDQPGGPSVDRSSLGFTENKTKKKAVLCSY